MLNSCPCARHPVPSPLLGGRRMELWGESWEKLTLTSLSKAAETQQFALEDGKACSLRREKFQKPQ